MHSDRYPDRGGDYGDDDDIVDDPDSDHRLKVPLEISSRQTYPIFLVGGTIRSAAGFGFGVSRKRSRRAKIVAAIAVGAIFATSGALIMRNIFGSTTTTAHPMDSEDDSKTASMDDDGTTAKSLSDDEPNPPIFPNSIKLFFPPRNEEELEAMRTTLREFSDPVLSWEDFSNSDNNASSRTIEAEEGGYHPEFTYTTEQHFSSRRTALLFAPGTYRNLDFQVGYYTSVIGLGAHPSGVEFTDCDRGPHCPALEKFTNRPPNGSGLDTFWRSIENVATDAREGMRWTVSQAAPLRRMHVRTDLNLFDGDSWASGGVAANVLVDGTVNFGGQQQWLMRNAGLGAGAVNGAWSLVFVGCTGNVPARNDGLEGGGPSISMEDDPSVRVEKPYIVLKTAGRSAMHGSRKRQQSNDALDNDEPDQDNAVLNQHRCELRVPSVTFGKLATGPQFIDEHEDIRDFRRVKLGVPSSSTDSTAAAIENHHVLQQALDGGKDLVLSPGIYPLSECLNVRKANQVILGLGYATLVAPENGSPCIRIQSGVAGVRIAGVMLEASTLHKDESTSETRSLLEWGSPTTDDPGDASNPGVLSDVFARVGGVRRDVSTDIMIHIHSGNIYGDNIWLWRADHVRLRPDEGANFPLISPKYRQTERGECMVKNGLVVGTGATNVTMVGLAVEHTTEDQTIWNGDGGHVYFYQCELPYDVDQSFGDNNYVGYRVGSYVTSHKAAGLGIYSNFRDYDVKVETAVVHPQTYGINMTNLFTVKLDNQGVIRSIVNGRGYGPTTETERGHPFRCSDEICSNQN